MPVAVKIAIAQAVVLVVGILAAVSVAALNAQTLLPHKTQTVTVEVY